MTTYTETAIQINRQSPKFGHNLTIEKKFIPWDDILWAKVKYIIFHPMGWKILVLGPLGLGY